MCDAVTWFPCNGGAGWNRPAVCLPAFPFVYGGSTAGVIQQQNFFSGGSLNQGISCAPGYPLVLLLLSTESDTAVYGNDTAAGLAQRGFTSLSMQPEQWFPVPLMEPSLAQGGTPARRNMQLIGHWTSSRLDSVCA